MAIAESERPEIKKQVMRLWALNFPPREKETLQEYVDTLAVCCRSTAHVKAVVDRVMESVSGCPAPAEFRRIAAELASTFTPPKPFCEACGGQGFVVVKRMYRGSVVEAAQPCSCRREAA